MTPKLHRAFLPDARLNETHLPRREPEQHLVPDSNLKARIQFEMYGEPNEEIDDIEGEERVTRLLAMCRNHPIIPAEIARGDAIHLELQLIRRRE